ncbi:Pectinesterase [Rhynchospora pubera]|uniref:Pectinesterase n=1 Tax=Rhynchospora pubera TaxID=906938 RepID=A0AAV8HEA5_9POAL|nr:Pectinesterase [Rhynchospora pubera]
MNKEFPSHVSLTVFLFVIQLSLLIFASPSPMDGASGLGIISFGFTTLNSIVSDIQAIEIELSQVQVPSSSMTLNICREVVGRSLKQFAYVQNAMDSITLTLNQASLAQMALTAANTYVRTCQQALDEAGEDSHGPFGSVILLLEAAGAGQCTTSQAISQAITEIAKHTPKQDNTETEIPITQATPGAIIESVPASRRVRVAKDGSGNFKTINDAVKNVPLNQNAYFLIYVDEGKYEEYVLITSDRPYLILAGAGEGKTIITGNRSTGTGWGTFYSSTVAVEAENFIGFNMTIENTAGPVNSQAVALRTSASFSAFHRCTILGFQDTLFVHVGYQFFRQCTIAGTIDFIFGYSSVVFQNCIFILRQPLNGQSNVITASGRNCSTDLTGISIHMSSIMSAPELKNTTVSYLGRPWGNYARSAFLLSNFKASIDPSRWYPMNGSPADVEFGEFDNPGLGTRASVLRNNGTLDHKLDRNSAYQFTVDRMLMGGNWIGNMTVPYTKGLFP